MKELRGIKVNGTYYIGRVEEGKIVDALDCQNSVDASDLRRWLRQDNIGELETITLSTGQGFTEKPLNKELTRQLGGYVAEFNEIKATALQVVQNDQFRERYER